MDFSGKDGPGPGEYEAMGDSALKENLNLKDEDRRRFEAKLPRYHELVVTQEEKKVAI